MRIGLAGPTVRNPGRRAGELEHARPPDRKLGTGDFHRRRRFDLGGSDGHELERALGIRVAVALLVRLVKPLGEAGAQRNGELEGLTRVTQIRLADRRQLSGFVLAARRTSAPRPGARRQPRARAPRGLPPLEGREPSPSRARPRARRRGAALRRRTRSGRSPAGSRPCSTETTRSARTISAFTTSMTASGSSLPSAVRAALASSSMPPGSQGGSRPSRRFASVTVGLSPPCP